MAGAVQTDGTVGKCLWPVGCRLPTELA